MPNIRITSANELHVHLYGCLTASDLWKLGKDRPIAPDRQEFFAREFHKAFSKHSQIESYWHSDEEKGLTLLKTEYEINTPISFEQFQAKINLPIAMFPLREDDDFLLRYVMQKHFEEKLSLVEYRLFMPPYFSPSQLDKYLTTLSRACFEFTRDHGPAFQPRLVFSLVRKNPIYLEHYEILRDWLARQEHLHKFVVGIDFCGPELAHPPIEKKEFLKKVLRDNAADPKRALAILYHVGEQIRELGFFDALLWCLDAAEFGAQRLGHACALGVDPKDFCAPGERLEEHQLHAISAWLKCHKDTIARFDLSPEVNVNEEQIFVARDIQKIICTILREKNTVIESCPRSNAYLCGVLDNQIHPLIGLSRENLNFIIATDDPGMFPSNLEQEYAFAQGNLGISPQDLLKSLRASRTYNSEAQVREIPQN